MAAIKCPVKPKNIKKINVLINLCSRVNCRLFSLCFPKLAFNFFDISHPIEASKIPITKVMIKAQARPFTTDPLYPMKMYAPIERKVSIVKIKFSGKI